MSETAEVMTGDVASTETDATDATNATNATNAKDVTSAAAGESCVCRRLRTKKAFGSFHGNLYSWQSGDSTTAVYWCLRTMETVGPDDGFAHPHACVGGRECYVAPE